MTVTSFQIINIKQKGAAFQVELLCLPNQFLHPTSMSVILLGVPNGLQIYREQKTTTHEPPHNEINYKIKNL